MELKIADVCISDSALMFLNKEIKKYNEMINSINDSLVSINEDIINYKIQIKTRQNREVLVEEVDAVKEGLKQVERYEAQDFPKIVTNINNLEAFVLKSLKNQLNEDNKKS
jgi:hypothetical protein